MTTLFNLAVRRQVLLERLKTAEVRKFGAFLTRVDTEIRERLSRSKLTDFSRARLEAQLAGLQNALRGVYREFGDDLFTTLDGLAVDSADYEGDSFRAVFPAGQSPSFVVPSPSQLHAAFRVNPLQMPGAHGGALLGKFIEQWADGDAEMVANAVRMGYALGETNDQIIGRIRGDAALNFADGVLAQNRNHAETIVRTSIQHVANSARSEMWAANSDIIDEYEWVSTLDSRTTTLCKSRDGKTYPVGKGPLPPAHPNCRSTTVAVIKGEFGKFLDEETERASVDGPVPANLTYYEWLKKQDRDFQDLALGPTRGQLFRDGGLSSADFSRLSLGRNFEPLTLEEMRKKKPKAFKRAGLSP